MIQCPIHETFSFAEVRRALAFLLIGCGAASPAVFGFEPAVRPVIEAYCVDCHGEEVQKAGLRLDNLASDLNSARTLATWVLIHDKISMGQMPPENKKQPPAALRDGAVKALYDALHTASLRRQREQGRTPIRRLNTTEYENTVRELMGTNVKLKELLPEDNSAAGFDNVASALDLSSTHLLLYQEAAEAAVTSVIPRHPHLPVKERRSGREMSEKGSNFQQTLNRSCKLDGDALIIYSKLPRYGLACTSHVPGRGRYRVRMSAAAVGEARQPVAAAFCTVDRGREPPIVREMIDFPPGAPQLIETEIDLEAGEAFVVNLLSNWDIRATKQPIEAYHGPGILLEWVEIEGPIDPYPSEAFRNLFGQSRLVPRSVARILRQGKPEPKIQDNRNIYVWLNDPLEPVCEVDPREESEKLIRAFLKRAFRRPVSEDLVQHYVGLVHHQLASGATWADALTHGYKCILTSPYFLFFIEPGSGPEVPVEPSAPTLLDSYALANRLSYFLTSSPPDEELWDSAAVGALKQPEELRRQTERLLRSPRVSRFVENFTGQWLDLRKVDATIPDPQLYGDFDGSLLWSMPLETRLFFEEILKTDRSLLEFVDSDWTMLNARLASHYGIPGVVGNDFRRVTLPADSPRGGVMTHASILKVTADGTTTSPVLRGKWVLERILGLHPSPPPKDVPAIEPDIRGATTIRQQLEKHRSVASCNSCHQHIDPPGFALECFDPIGGFREFYRASSRTDKGIVNLPGYTGRAFYRGPDVEKGGVTPDGKVFDSIAQYKAILLENPDQIARSLTEKLLVYATGAEPQFADREIVEGIVFRLKQKNYGLRSLIHEIVQSRPFLNK